MEYYVCDLRPSWAKNWAITFWRPNNSGYAYHLSCAGRYDEATVIKGGSYYLTSENGNLIRFPVPCDVADALAAPTPSGKVDGNAGPVVLNTAKNRSKLRKAAFVFGTVADFTP